MGMYDPDHPVPRWSTSTMRRVAEEPTLADAALRYANLGVISALAGRDDALFADKLNHASLNDAVVLSRASLQRYAHNDMAALERLLRASTAKRKLIVVDAVFSMDGDLAPIAELASLCERYDAYLLLDDAHGFGVLGHQGRGIDPARGQEAGLGGALHQDLPQLRLRGPREA